MGPTVRPRLGSYPTTPHPPVRSPEAERHCALRAERTLYRRLTELIAAGKYAQALHLTHRLEGLLDTIPVEHVTAAVWAEHGLADAKEDVVREQLRQDPDLDDPTAIRSYLAHAHPAHRQQGRVIRALELRLRDLEEVRHDA